MARQQVFHQPVLLNEVVHWMNLRDDGVYCDCTVGGAGHLLAMLRRTRQARFIAIDCDPAAVAFSRHVIADYRHRCFIFENNFVNLDLILNQINVPKVDGILFDLGVSYHQLTTPERGFSFERNGELLMRMSPKIPSLRARLCKTGQEELAGVLREYGDVRNYKKIARMIFERRDVIATTLDLRRVIEEAVPRRFLKKNLHKVFQSLRIWINDELGKLKGGLAIAFHSLDSEGRILVISYHSGEDRIVKRFFRALKDKHRLRILNKKVIKPSASEIDKNPSARSARLRVIERCVS
jgi:16S rRNA (cytosine1402-N4)-methyltransferase